jgi:predicted transcriptional regulator
MIILMVLLLIVLAAGTLTVFMERTSYPIQSVLVKGGDVNEDAVLSVIQDRPGIGFFELSRRSGIARKNMIATLNHLERNGMARAVIDGASVKFLPMMGAFVDGPLALNRYQERILEILDRGGRLTMEEMSEASGYSRRKTERELKMLELKGSITSRKSEDKAEYYLTRRQRNIMRKND